MLNPEKSSPKKGRWLVLEQTDRTKDEVIALIRAIDGAEVQIINAKTYVRFPESRGKSFKPVTKVIKMLCSKQPNVLIADNDSNPPRQYCAVMLKNKR